jgi:hypothetical protein
MKKQIIKATSLRFLLAASVLSTSTAALASPKSELTDLMIRPVYKVDSLLAVQPEVRYIGYNDDYYFFELQVSNPSASKLEIVLTDRSTKSMLYTELITDQYYQKKVAVPRENVLLRWDVTNKSIKGKMEQKTYSLNTEVKLKEEVKVTKL